MTARRALAAVGLAVMALLTGCHHPQCPGTVASCVSFR